MSPPPSPLKSRDVNTSPTKTLTLEKESEKPKSMEMHRQVLQSRLEEDKAKRNYISPSDMIMSPATQKLSALKGKRFGKAKPQSLFANAMSKNAGAVGSGELGAASLDAEVGKVMDGEVVKK